MEKILFLYSSTHGQTPKILATIAEHISEQYESEIVDLHTCNKIDFTQYAKIVVGAAIRYGNFNKKVYKFVNQYTVDLQKSKAIFICVNLTARKEDQGKDTPEKSAYIKKFLQKIVWQPKLIGVFAGALDYQSYNFVDRIIIKFIMYLTKGDTNTASAKIEYTNWTKVKLFAEKIKTL